MVNSCSRENGVLCTVARSWLLFLQDESEWRNFKSNIAWSVDELHQTFWFEQFFNSKLCCKIHDLLSVLIANKLCEAEACEVLWVLTDLISVFSSTEPFLRDFLYIFRKLLDFFSYTECKIVASTLGTFFHSMLFWCRTLLYLYFRLLTWPLQCLVFFFYQPIKKTWTDVIIWRLYAFLCAPNGMRDLRQSYQICALCSVPNKVRELRQS